MSILISDGLGGLVTSSGGASPGGGPTPPDLAPAAAQFVKRPKPFPGQTVTFSLAPATTTDIAPAASAFDEVL